MKLKVNYFAILFLLSVFIVSCDEDDTQIPENPQIDFTDCVTPGNSSKLEVVTFNMKEFPVEGDETILYASDLLNHMDADIIAVQEISSAYNLEKLANAMPGWNYLFSPVQSWTMSLGYLYKTSEIQLMTDYTEALFPDDTYAFPRPPLKIKVKHIPTDEDVYIINNHFKCCSGEDNVARRRSAVEQLKAYIDENLSTEKVIVVGDMNDRIDGADEESNVFWSFIVDSLNYRFSDMSIATGNSSYWSYPSYPSHLDHLLITNECFDYVDTVFTVRPDMCEPDYRSVVSDHRPVELVLF
ncbi:MAG: endonuclease [Chlorobi bacterium]|nr:endonuclease [Chlorobiota bacterium]